MQLWSILQADWCWEQILNYDKYSDLRFHEVQCLTVVACLILLSDWCWEQILNYDKYSDLRFHEVAMFDCGGLLDSPVGLVLGTNPEL